MPQHKQEQQPITQTITKEQDQKKEQGQHYSTNNNFQNPIFGSCIPLNPNTKKRYPDRFKAFLDYANISGIDIKENVNSFYKLIEKHGTRWLEVELLKFFGLQNMINHMLKYIAVDG